MSMEELGGIGDDIGEVSQGTEEQESSESKEQAIARIEKEQKKAAQTRGQIQRSKKQNVSLAKFLTFILQNVSNDKIIELFHDVFFHKTDTGVSYVNHKVFAGMLAPFYWIEAQEVGVSILFDELYSDQVSQSLETYIEYLKKLSYKYHDNIALNQQGLLQLIIEILKHFHVTNTKDYTDEQKKDFIITIVHEIFGIQNKIDVKKVIL